MQHFANDPQLITRSLHHWRTSSPFLAATLLALLTLVGSLLSSVIHANTNDLGALAWGDHRAEGHTDRNRYRHPVETLEFFGLSPNASVLEISPGGAGWYTEILAPYLRKKGSLTVTGSNPESDSEYAQQNAVAFVAKMDAHPKLYDKVKVSVMDLPGILDFGKTNSFDLVLTFRNFHGWLRGGHADEILAEVKRVLKPGGVLGVVQHRGIPGMPGHLTGGQGYIDAGYLIGYIEASGFKLDEQSEINANPLDTKDYPEFVWNLPPTLDGPEETKAEMLKIGESDRTTLRFVLPE